MKIDNWKGLTSKGEGENGFPIASAEWSPCSAVLVANGMNRKFPERNFHPLASCNFVAHQHIVVPELSEELKLECLNRNNSI
jgi:hypothetical protein